MTETAAAEATALDGLREQVRGEVIAESDPLYDGARSVWNGMIDRRPALVVRCSGNADVIAAVAFAREQGLPLSVRGGGHNVAGTAVADGCVLIDLSPMRNVFVDVEARTVRAGAGARLGDVDHETQPFGLAVPFGVVSRTGIAGKSLFLADVDDKIAELCTRYAASRPSPLTSVDVWALGGAMRTEPAGGTAFAKRDAPFLLGIEANWDERADDDANLSWARELFGEANALSPGGTTSTSQGSSRKESSCCALRTARATTGCKGEGGVRPGERLSQQPQPAAHTMIGTVPPSALQAAPVT
jgi:FAD binding domain